MSVPVAGESLHVSVETVPKPRGTILLVHGFLSESREFADAQRRLAAKGWTSAAVDLRGHGHSTGPRGYASARVASEDLAATIDALRKEGYAEPYFVVGHSTGCALLLKFLDGRKDVRGAVLVAPLTKLLDQVGAAERAGYKAAIAANKAVMKLGLPSIKVPYKYASRGGYRKLFDSRDAADRAFKEGFLQKKADTAWAEDMLAIDGEAWARRVSTPTLVVRCTNDRVLKPESPRLVHAALAGPKELVEIATCHSAWGDAKVGEVVEAVDAWFGRRVGPG